MRRLVLWLSAVLALPLQQQVQLVSLLVLEPTAANPHTPPTPRLRLLLVGGVSFGFSFQFECASFLQGIATCYHGKLTDGDIEVIIRKVRIGEVNSLLDVAVSQYYIWAPAHDTSRLSILCSTYFRVTKGCIKMR
jgi:hypothetical protein